MLRLHRALAGGPNGPPPGLSTVMIGQLVVRPPKVPQLEVLLNELRLHLRLFGAALGALLRAICGCQGQESQPNGHQLYSELTSLIHLNINILIISGKNLQGVWFAQIHFRPRVCFGLGLKLFSKLVLEGGRTAKHRLMRSRSAAGRTRKGPRPPENKALVTHVHGFRMAFAWLSHGFHMAFAPGKGSSSTAPRCGRPPRARLPSLQCCCAAIVGASGHSYGPRAPGAPSLSQVLKRFA